MQSAEIRQKFLEFFEKRGHIIVLSASLVPSNDPSVLFTSAGMQPFKPYYVGQADARKDFGSLNVASVQKCVRTSDIDEVGDESHLTFFEMLGNFSFGGYGKQETIEYAYEFITGEMGLKIDYVSIFSGDKEIPADAESGKIWQSIDKNLEIRRAGRADNFWGPTGEQGPCGPTTEIYVNGLEIWNIVFNEYYHYKDKTLKPLEVRGIDTGMGLERLAMVSQKVPTVFDTDLFIFVNSAKSAQERIIADHVRTAVFMIADNVRPSNTERGYVLRRLIRRVTKSDKSQADVAEAVVENYQDVYPELKEKKKIILDEIQKEENKFRETMSAGLKMFEKGEDPFVLHTTYGFPIDLTKDLAARNGKKIDLKAFEKKFKEHQKVSRAGMEQKFKGGLAGHSEMEVKYHTATHLLHQALHDVLGEGVEQRGSNITPERLRFDFSFPRKLTDEEKEKVENMVNEKIQSALPVQHSVLDKEEALKSGARHFFDQKYPDEVSVYYIGNSLEKAYSKEFCGGPHVDNIRSLGKFRITNEEASSAGVRRIKAVLDLPTGRQDNLK